MAQTKNKTEQKARETEASTETQTGGQTPAAGTLEAARQKRAADMSVAGKKEGAAKEKAAKEKKPAFVVNEKERQKYLEMSDEDLLKAAEGKLRPSDASNADVYKPTGSAQDYLNGQDVSRSGIRAAVLHFLQNRPGKRAPVNVICAYMKLTEGLAYKGKFDYGYLTTKDGAEGKRGMVARRLIELHEKGAIKQEGEAEPASA